MRIVGSVPDRRNYSTKNLILCLHSATINCHLQNFFVLYIVSVSYLTSDDSVDEHLQLLVFIKLGDDVMSWSILLMYTSQQLLAN